MFIYFLNSIILKNWSSLSNVVCQIHFASADFGIIL